MTKINMAVYCSWGQSLKAKRNNAINLSDDFFVIHFSPGCYQIYAHTRTNSMLQILLIGLELTLLR